MATPFRTRLYRRAGWAVICLAVALAAVPFTLGQYAKRSTQSKGPRALGLLEFLPNGKARLRPICIMINGHFYDAGIYKADPVPMALDTGVVYEAERTGESQGLFTVKNVLENQAKQTFVAEGTWIPGGAEAPKTASTKPQAKPKPSDDEDQPPVLRRPGSEPSKPENKPVTPSTTAQNTPKPDEDSDRPILRKPQSETSTSQGHAPGTPSATPGSSSGPSASSANANNAPGAETSEEDDPNRPHLRRGPPSPAALTATKPEKPSSTSKAKAQGTSSMATQRQVMPAISDADGPEPRPYSYDMTLKEEQAFRAKVLTLASAQLVKDARQLEPELLRQAEESRQIRSGRVPSKPPVQPVWDDVQLRVFDVATNNEPILVLSAKAHLPERAKASAKEGSSQASATTEFYVTVVAHSDLYGELKSLFAAVTDDRTLDVTPKYQLIDVVDADGDGRGEMLFRRTSDQGSSFAVYRVGADQLWPLYEGTPGQ